MTSRRNGGTPAQRENGFEDATEDFFRYMMMAGGPDADEARVRLHADNALDHYHWLKQQGGSRTGTATCPASGRRRGRATA